MEAEYGLGARRAFRPSAMPWAPFHLALLQTVIIEPNLPTIERASPNSEAVAHARLAVTWERLGRAEAANREFSKALQLTGTKDVGKWRTTGLETVDMWSRARDEKETSAQVPSQHGGAQPVR